ncbi:hypothetical protein ASE48_08580 [Mycobacterium sp. Root265]|nr:hypothetical protein ASE48_08580 [Mycobacterium sp. Root265]
MGDPDNPRDWDPNHKTLKYRWAPHETAGVLRMQRAGYKGKQILDMFPRLKGTKLMRELQNAMDAESTANEARRPIHDARISRT